MRLVLSLLLIVLSLDAATACTSFVLEDDGDLYFVHSLNQGSVPAVAGAAYVNPRGVRNVGFRTDDLFAAEPAGTPELVWRSRFGSVTFSPLGRGLPDGGLNEAGLFIWEMGFDTVYPEDDGIPILFQMQWMQYQLDNHATVDEVLANLDRVNPDGWGWHYFVADASGDAAVIDFPDGRAEVHTGAGLPLLLCGNSYYPDAVDWVRRHEFSGGDLAYRRQFDELPRFVTGARMLKEFAGQDPVDYAFGMLQAMSVNVRWSVVFDLRRGTAHFNTNLDEGIRSFGFGAGDFEPGSPVLRLDVDTPGPGDVRGRFEPWTPAADEGLLRGIVGLVVGEEVDPVAVASAMVSRLHPAGGSDPDDWSGVWRGTLTVPAGGAEKDLPMALTLDGGDRPRGTASVEGLGDGLPLLSVEEGGGLLSFVLENPADGDRFRFFLHRNVEACGGTAYSWTMGREKTARVALVHAAG